MSAAAILHESNVRTDFFHLPRRICNIMYAISLILTAAQISRIIYSKDNSKEKDNACNKSPASTCCRRSSLRVVNAARLFPYRRNGTSGFLRRAVFVRVRFFLIVLLCFGYVGV
jgi:hypothetical protein